MNDEGMNLGLMRNCGNYNSWIASKLRPFVKGRVLELGCGVGSVAQFFFNKDYYGLDIKKDNVGVCNDRFGDNFRVGDVVSSCAFRDKTFDSVLCVNLLEHIDDDLGALHNSWCFLKPGGCFVGLIPAHPFLFGSVDIADSHKRRYSKKDLLLKLNKAGFTVMKFYSFNFVGWLGWFYHGKVLKLKVHNEGELGLFDKLVPFLSKFDRFVPFGLSWFVVARKEQFFNYEGKFRSESDMRKIIEDVKRLKRTKLVLNKVNFNDEVLDLGCGCGVHAFELSKKCKSVLGVDMLKGNIRIAEHFFFNYNLSFQEGKVEDITGTFDTILLNEVIEHLQEPFQMLQKCHLMLRKGGRLILTTPNAISPTNIAINVLKGISDVKKEQTGVGIETDHIFVWDIRTLTRLLREAKLELIKYETTKYSLIVEVVKK